MGDAGLDILKAKFGIRHQDFLNGIPVSQKIKDQRDPDAATADTRLSG
jgi:hypothetical protein